MMVAARALYKKAGFAETNIMMTKQIIQRTAHNRRNLTNQMAYIWNFFARYLLRRRKPEMTQSS